MERSAFDEFVRFQNLFQAVNRLILVNTLFSELHDNKAFEAIVARERMNVVSDALTQMWRDVYPEIEKVHAALKEVLCAPTSDEAREQLEATVAKVEAVAEREYSVPDAEHGAKYMNEQYAKGYSVGQEHAIYQLQLDIRRALGQAD